MEESISVERAMELITANADAVGTETIPAVCADGRVLAVDVRAPIDMPPWPRSPLDGYAFRAEDSVGAGRETPVSLRVVETIYAGGWTDRTVKAAEAVRLMTGTPIPEGCDCVIRQEDTDLGMDTVRIFKQLRPGENYCYAGEDFSAGDVILPAGMRLRGNALGILSAAGLFRSEVTLSVFRKVRCALFCTGDELVANDVQPLPKGKIYSSNGAVISSRLKELGIELTAFRNTFDDDPSVLAEGIQEAFECADVVLTTGGVSVGEKDILRETISALGAKKIFWRVLLKPGSPIMFSQWRGKPILSLSGNPFAASATFELFARPLLAKLAGAEDLLPQVLTACMDTPFPKFGAAPRFVRGAFHNGHVVLPNGHSSGQLASSVGTNCLVELPPRDRPFETGDTVRVFVL